MKNPYLSDHENKVEKEFYDKGYVIIKQKNNDNFKFIRNFISKNAKKNIKTKIKDSDFDILNLFHKKISVKHLNEFRLSIINKINSSKKFKERFFYIFKEILTILVGSELVMQKKFNLSIQLPNDSSSLLPIHSDVWSGDSPFEVVAWFPLVDVYKSKSMYILPPKHLDKLDKILSKNALISSEKLYDKIKKYLVWIDIKFGEAIIFNQMLPHGNIINSEHETRWTINCRFKGAYTPYGDKKIGEFFEPITLKPASKIAMKYKFPRIK